MKESTNFADYIWNTLINPQMSYAFSKNHSTPYTFVGIQNLVLATNWPSIYWNTACLIVNSGGAFDEEDEEFSAKKVRSTDYGKISKAIGDIRSSGINVSLVNVNKSEFEFVPDEEDNRILFGFKGMLNVGDDVIDAIIQNRPYSSIKDFYERVKPKRQAMISLIKGGAFDEMEDRKFAMAWYIWETCDKKSRLTLQNMGALMKYNLLGKETKLSQAVYEFNRYLKILPSSGGKITLDERAINFLSKIDLLSLIENENKLDVKKWEKQYKKSIDPLRLWLAAHHDETLEKLNTIVFEEDWKKYAQGNYSAWEMEVLCFYYHEHELKDVNFFKYGLSNYSTLGPKPQVEKVWNIKGKQINSYKLVKICGTCIAKDKNKAILTLLTPHGIANVKFRKEQFAILDAQISRIGPDGKKVRIEKSWFTRGQKLIIQGIRIDDNFIVKSKKNESTHSVYRITNVKPNGDLEMTAERAKGEYGADEE